MTVFGRERDCQRTASWSGAQVCQRPSPCTDASTRKAGPLPSHPLLPTKVPGPALRPPPSFSRAADSLGRWLGRGVVRTRQPDVWILRPSSPGSFYLGELVTFITEP